MRLFDQLKRSGFRPVLPMPDDLLKNAYWLSRQWMAELDKANPVIVVIDNVADYYWERTEQTWTMPDFPCLSPPWPLTFLEYHAPAKIVLRDGSTTPFERDALGRHFGILLDSVEPGTDIAFTSEAPCLPSFKKSDIPELCDGLGWVQQASVFSELQGDILLWGTFRWGINEDGVLCEGWQDQIGGLPFMPAFTPNLSEEESHTHGHNCWCLLAPALLAVSFIHCRNTVIRDVAPEPRLQKANLKRGKPPYVRYKTLEIDPVKKILSVKGNAETTGLKHALHICRGHFKDYREHGLFGKYKDLYWWDAHLRGTASQGVVIKDYAVKRQ